MSMKYVRIRNKQNAKWETKGIEYGSNGLEPNGSNGLEQKLVYDLCKIAYFPYIKALFGLYNPISASSASFGL